MLVKYLLEKYKQDVASTLSVVTEDIEKQSLIELLRLLENDEYLINAMVEDFNVEEAPEQVYLFDKQRNMFWKCRYGYTREIISAYLFSLEEAKRIVEDDYNNNTKIVYF